MTRSTSAASSSSLDPYYFTSLAPAESPVPPLPAGPDVIPRTPELPLALPPTTPARNPATIDRRGLVGVGELATPRWTRYEHATRHAHDLDIVDAMDDVAEVDELALAENDGERETDSPWTIEAVDELRDEVRICLLPSSAGFLILMQVVDENPNAPMAIRARASMASESGGEEILYPRKATNSDVFHPMSSPTPAVPLQPNATREDLTSSDPSTIGSSSSTAGSYAQFGTPITAKQRRPRTSDPDTDSSGVFSPKHASPRDKLREDKLASVRKHQSLGLGIGSSTATPRDNSHRESSTLGSSSVVRASSTKHSRSSSSSSQVKRGHDFSHLPPSPSATSLHHSVKHAPAGSTTSPHHTSNVVAHSLLRGTQEGWSSMDDEATAEALRKLDGVSGKSPHARGRTSIGSRPTSMSRPNSRPGTPGAVRGSQWEGIAAFEGGGRSSRSSKKTSSSGDEKRVSTSSKAAPSTGLDDEFSEGHISSQSVDRLSSTKKRSSVVASKRGSGSSTTYTGTPTASSRDSGSISVGTSLTSASANSHRQSLKAQRNSAGSDISVHSSEVASLKDRAAALMSTNEVFESEHVPPVPPLPKDLSSFRSPPQSSTSVHFPTIPMPPRMDETDPDQTVSMDTAPVPDSPLHGQALSPVSPVQAQSQERPPTSAYTPASRPTPKTPSKKWSFNLKLPGSPASPRNTAPKAISSPISSSVPTETTIPPLTVKRSMDAWSQPDAMMSAASLGSLSSVGSVRGSPAASLAPSFTITSSPDPMQAQVPLLTTTATRTSIDQASGGLAPAQTPLSPSSSLRRGSSTRRLTPSSIPFFRRSSSQVAQPQSESEALRSRSPPLASPAKKPAARLRVKSTISPTDASLSSPATPGSTQKKSSMLSFLRGSSSRKSLQSDREQADARSDREQRKLGKEAEKSIDKDRKKDDKDRSESRISVLMGRKRGKVCLVVCGRRRREHSLLCRHSPHQTQRKPSRRSPCLPSRLAPCPRLQFNE
jgi:dual specificity tyrosine-phosphorylation-regulated kinase 2/3/4